VDPGENGAILDAGGVEGPGPPGGGRNRQLASDNRQWRRLDVTKCRKAQETGSSQHQATFRHRVCIICIYACWPIMF
jgi:hypothetical protein